MIFSHLLGPHGTNSWPGPRIPHPSPPSPMVGSNADCHFDCRFILRFDNLEPPLMTSCFDWSCCSPSFWRCFFFSPKREDKEIPKIFIYKISWPFLDLTNGTWHCQEKTRHNTRHLQFLLEALPAHIKTSYQKLALGGA